MGVDRMKFGRIGILAGGPSSEREISLKSGEAVYNTLKDAGFETVFMDISEHIEEDIREARIDKAFIALHGGFGEDGTIQSILENLKIPYTGSGPEASRLALDKLASRIIFEEAGLKVPRYKALGKNDEIEIGALRLPLIVKPQREGSSVGLSLVLGLNGLGEACREAFRYGDMILVEEYIKGRELTVGILDDRPLPVIEIIPAGNFYDYNAKYKSPETKYVVPAPIKRTVFKEAQTAGIRAHRALGCRSFSRVDMILGEDGIIYVLEINTIPGLTSRSLLPKAAQEVGIDFAALCRRILEGVSR